MIFNLMLSFLLLLQNPVCKGVQCTVGCLPYGSICPSENEIRLQQNLPLAKTEPAKYNIPIIKRKTELSDSEDKEGLKWKSFKRKLGFGLGFGIPAGQFLFTGSSFAAIGSGFDQTDEILGKPNNRLHPLTVTGMTFIATGIIFGIIAIVLSR